MSGILSLLFTFIQSPQGLELITGNLPRLLDFVTSLNTKIAEAKARGAGQEEVMAAARDLIAAHVKLAADAAAAAEADHAAHPNDDSGFDPDVFRKDPA
jgi:hypothetical protein